MWEQSQNLMYSQCILDNFLVVLVQVPFQTESKTFKADRVLEGPFP